MVENCLREHYALDKCRKHWARNNKSSTSAWHRLKLIMFLGGECAHCGFRDIRALQLDHINGGGNKDIVKFGGRQFNGHQKMMRFYKNNPNEAIRTLQVLCANCNFIKMRENKESKRIWESFV